MLLFVDFFTINEPQCVVGLGHLSGVHAPGVKLSIKETFQIAHNLMKAHGQAVINLREYAKQPIKIGYAPTGGVAYPYTDTPEYIEAAKKIFGIVTLIMLLVLLLGELILPDEREKSENNCKEFEAQWQQVLENGEKVSVEVPGKIPAEYG